MLLFAWISVDSDYPVTQSFANVVLLKYLAMILFYFDFLKRKMPLIRNVAQENLGNKAHRNCSGFVPQAGAKLKATWSMFPCFLTEVSVISGELYSWTSCSTMHHSWPDGVDKVHQNPCRNLTAQTSSPVAYTLLLLCFLLIRDISQSHFRSKLLIPFNNNTSYRYVPLHLQVDLGNC